MKIYIYKKKNLLLYNFKIFYNLIKTCNKTKCFIEKICSNYCFKLQSKRVK